MKKLIDWKRKKKTEEVEVRRAESFLTIATITFANGGDNVAIYTPLFGASSAGTLAITLITFAVMIALWCLAGYAIGNHFAVIRLIDRYGHILVPFVFIALGFYILLGSQIHL